MKDHTSSLPTANLYIVHHTGERWPPGQQTDQSTWADLILKKSKKTQSLTEQGRNLTLLTS